MLVAAFELRWPVHHARVRSPGYACLSANRAAQLERAVARLDRVVGRPVAAARLVDLVAAHQVTDFAGVLKSVDGPAAGGVAWVDGQPVIGGRVSRRHGHDGPLPVSAALFAQQLHRESKVAAIRARGGRTYDELRVDEKIAAAAELHRQVNSGKPPIDPKTAKLALRARRGDPQARLELSRLLARQMRLEEDE